MIVNEQINLIVKQLLRMLEVISLNAGYARYFENQQALIDHQVYFDICQIIFPQLSIKIIKILQYDGFSASLKLQELIQLLGLELGIDMNKISGKQIKMANIIHIHRLLEILLQYSKIYMQSKQVQVRVKTDPTKSENQKNFILNSKSDRAKNCDKRSSSSSLIDSKNKEQGRLNVNINSNKNKNKNKNNLDDRNRRMRRIKNTEQNQNIYENVMNILIEQKNNGMKYYNNSTDRNNNNKNKNNNNNNKSNKLNSELILTQKKYKSYLKDYYKENISKKKNKIKRQNKEMKNYNLNKCHKMPFKQFQQIDNFFQSFAYKFRDYKVAYLRRIKKLIHNNEKQRRFERNTIQRQNKLYEQKQFEKQIKCAKNQHKIRYDLINERNKQLSDRINIMKKQLKSRNNSQKQSLKQTKREELNNIEIQMKQQNERILMDLQQGGRLEEVIKNLYKKY